MGSYRFARSPRWVLSHLVVLGLVVLMVSLGFWQLRRLDERRQFNALVRQRTEEAPVAVGDALDDPRFRLVTASGRYDEAATVLVRRNQAGAPGAWVVTPLRLADGVSVVGVLRGFVGSGSDGGLVAPPAPPGEVEVEGQAVVIDRLDQAARRALEGVAGSEGALPVLIQLTTSAPPDDALTRVPPPELDEGPHLSYAVQWFVFSIVGLVGYPLVLRQQARRPMTRES